VVLISGEAGIGKSSLVEGLRKQVGEEGLTRVAFRGSPYHTNSAFYPIMTHVQRVLDWQPGDSEATRLSKLEQALGQTSLALEEAVPLLAALLSLPLPEGRYAALGTSPQQQRQQTQDVLVAWLSEEAARQPVLAVWEDLHWADPSTLETLELFVEQAPTAAMLHVLTFRPEFEPPWPLRSHLTPITLNRLERAQVEALVERQAGGKGLPVEVVAHIVGKTDGVPLYVEELTKMLLGSELLREEAEAYVLTGPLLTVAIPDTLQDSLMARLDQMNTAKEVEQLGSVLGREFAYEMLEALSSQDEETLQTGLAQLVAAELLYQQGRPPRAKYLFKHALIQDTAYASLLRSTRQRVHRQIAELLEARFPETVERQPEVVAHHYTEAGLHEPAIIYWQQAGPRAGEQSANREAVHHLTKGLELLATLPDKGERPQQELDFQMTLGPVLMATQGYGGPDVERVYTRARQLCQQVGETPQLFPVLWGLCRFYTTRGELQTARELGGQLLRLAQHQDDLALLVAAHNALGQTLFYLGAFASARTHLEEGVAIYDPQQHHSHALQYVDNPGLHCLTFASWALWYLGYPEQALHRSQQACTLAQELAHPGSQAMALYRAARLRQYRRDVQQAYELAEASMTISTEHGVATYLALGTFLRGWALFQQGQGGEEEAMAQMRQGLAAIRAVGNEVALPGHLVWLAEAYGKRGQAEEGLPLLDEAWSIVDKSGQSYHNAELHRIEGELRL
jgi:predicted ATPase